MANIAKNKKYHFIYKTTNLINEKYYIGKHSTNNLEDGYLGSGTYLRRSIRKYGKENFKREVLEFCETYEKLGEREKELITLNEIVGKQCMNLKPGGLGGLNNEEHKQKFTVAGSKAHRKYLKEDCQYKEKYSFICKQRNKKRNSAFFIIGKGKDWTGLKHTEESKRKIGQANSLKQQGSKNSQFGTCWIMKEGVSKKIKREELKNYLTLGWIKGRK